MHITLSEPFPTLVLNFFNEGDNSGTMYHAFVQQDIFEPTDFMQLEPEDFKQFYYLDANGNEVYLTVGQKRKLKNLIKFVRNCPMT